MASTATFAGTLVPQRPDARDAERRFYAWLTGTMVLIAVGGFFPSYWAKLATGESVGAPIVYFHGTLFSAWTLFLFTQSLLVANGQVMRHRAWGMAGISLATAMALSVVPAVLNTIHVAEGIGAGDAARRFAAVPLMSLPFWVVLVTLAVANVNKSDVHKRLMILATVAMLQAAMGRVFKMLLAPDSGHQPIPVALALPAAGVVDMLVVAAMIYDWRTRGRPHRVYVVGGGIMLAEQFLTVPVSNAAWWLPFVRSIEALLG